MEWTIRLEAKTGWGEVEAVEPISITRPVLAATADDVELSFAEAKSLLAGGQGRPARRFALVRSAAENPAGLVRTALTDQGWQRDQPVTMHSRWRRGG
jgi:hypothetical protein